MPQIDLTITVTVVIAVCAIVSPVITTLLNNHHLYKMKKLEMKLEQEKSSLFYKRGIYEEYLKATGKCVYFADSNRIAEYGEVYLLALVYFPPDLRNDLISINALISNYSWKEARNALNEFTPKINNVLQKM